MGAKTHNHEADIAAPERREVLTSLKRKAAEQPHLCRQHRTYSRNAFNLASHLQTQGIYSLFNPTPHLLTQERYHRSTPYFPKSSPDSTSIANESDKRKKTRGEEFMISRKWSNSSMYWFPNQGRKVKREISVKS